MACNGGFGDRKEKIAFFGGFSYVYTGIDIQKSKFKEKSRKYGRIFSDGEGDLHVAETFLYTAGAGVGAVDGLAGLLQALAGLFQCVGKAPEIALHFGQQLPHLAGALLDRQRAKAERQAV